MNWEALSAIWPVLMTISGVGFSALVFSISQNFKLKQLEKEFSELKEHKERDDKVIWETIGGIRETLQMLVLAVGRVEGKMDAKK